MEPLISRIRYEEPSYIEEYTAQLSKPNYISYKQRLDTGIIIGKYFILKRYGNLTKKSLRPLPPTAYYGTIMPTEEDLEWKIRFGPYQLRQDMLVEPVIWDIKQNLSKHNHLMKEDSLEALLTPLFCRLREQYPEIIKNWQCPDNYGSEQQDAAE